MNILGKLKKVLGALTDILLIGRNRGWWSRKQRLEYLKARKKR